MTAFMDVKTVHGPGGEWYVRVPDDHLLCLVSKDTAEAHAEWRECAAVRIGTNEDGTVASLEVAPDLEWLTSGEADSAG